MENTVKFKDKYLFIFILLQIFTAQLLMQFMKFHSIGFDKDFFAFMMSLCYYLIIFIIPVFLYLKFADRVKPYTYLKLDINLYSGIKNGLLIGIGIFIFLWIKNRLQVLGQIDLREDQFILLGKILVGPLEEIPFRGFYLQKMNEYMGFWKANLLSSILFAFMHISVKGYSNPHSMLTLILIMVIGLWMGYIFKKTQSLWCVAIIHSIFDLSIWVIL